jgi:hypothetical protein
MPRASGRTPSFARADSGSFVTSMPSTCAVPRSGAMSEVTMRIVVVLPAPFGPCPYAVFTK